MWFLRFSIAIIRTAFEKNSQLSIHTVQVGGWMVFFFENLLSYLAYSQIWLNIFNGSCPLWLQHNIDLPILNFKKKIRVGVNVLMEVKCGWEETWV
jgi:hypothetical protein